MKTSNVMGMLLQCIHVVASVDHQQHPTPRADRNRIPTIHQPASVVTKLSHVIGPNVISTSCFGRSPVGSNCYAAKYKQEVLQCTAMVEEYRFILYQNY